MAIALLIYAIPSPLQTATIKIGVLGGSSAEGLAEKGAAHLLASGAFDGNAHKNGVAVMRAFEDIGAVVSAEASREQITYSIAVGSENAAQALELALDNFKAPIARDYVSSTLGLCDTSVLMLVMRCLQMIEHARRRAAVKYANFMANPSERVFEVRPCSPLHLYIVYMCMCVHSCCTRHHSARTPLLAALCTPPTSTACWSRMYCTSATASSPPTTCASRCTGAPRAPTRSPPRSRHRCPAVWRPAARPLSVRALPAAS